MRQALKSCTPTTRTAGAWGREPGNCPEAFPHQGEQPFPTSAGRLLTQDPAWVYPCLGQAILVGERMACRELGFALQNIIPTTLDCRVDQMRKLAGKIRWLSWLSTCKSKCTSMRRHRLPFSLPRCRGVGWIGHVFGPQVFLGYTKTVISVP